VSGGNASRVRHVLVPPSRVRGWVERFRERNGGATLTVNDDGITLAGANGCIGVLSGPWDEASDPPSSPEVAILEQFLAALVVPRTVGLVLVRRGGYAVGVAREGQLLDSKTGTRYVQSRTAAGGWSQQRFARRRENQAAGLVEAAAGHASTVFGRHSLDGVQAGGDKSLAADVLAAEPLRPYRDLPQLPFLTVPDPRLTVLRQAAVDAFSVRVAITDP
jgi:hypothetical protein